MNWWPTLVAKHYTSNVNFNWKSYLGCLSIILPRSVSGPQNYIYGWFLCTPYCNAVMLLGLRHLCSNFCQLFYSTLPKRFSNNFLDLIRLFFQKVIIYYLTHITITILSNKKQKKRLSRTISRSEYSTFSDVMLLFMWWWLN